MTAPLLVTTQAALDKAIADGITDLIVDAVDGAWLTVNDGSVVAWGSSRVEARGSSRVEAWGSSRVEAWGSSRVEAWDSSRVEARGSSRVEARDSSRVEAWDSSRVEARDSSSVEAWDSSSVEARDSSSVEAWGSSSVEAWDSSSVEAGPWVAVHLWSQRVTLTGDGHLIDMTTVDLADPATWCSYHGVTVTDGIVTLYKAVDNKWTTGRGADYSPGSMPEAPDWRADDQCGGGLHFGPTPRHARDYQPRASRFVEVGVRLDEMRPIASDGTVAKCKARRVVVACREVTIDGAPVA